MKIDCHMKDFYKIRMKKKRSVKEQSERPH